MYDAYHLLQWYVDLATCIHVSTERQERRDLLTAFSFIKTKYLFHW